MVHHKIRNILGTDVRARYSDSNIQDYDPFRNPIIHKRINGTDVVPLNVTKLWGK